MEPQEESKLEALRRIARIPEEWGERQKAKLRSGMESFEDYATSNPEDDVVGPALATGSSMLRDMFLQPIDPDAPKMGAMPMPKFGSMLGKAKKATKDARTEALKDIANKKPTLKENLDRIDKLDDKQSMELFDRMFGGVDKAGITASDARRYTKMATQGRSKEALAELKALQKQPTIKRDVIRGLDE